MDIQLIDDSLLSELHQKGAARERKRINFDLRTTPEDTSQRMLNVLEPGTHVPIHRHTDTTETVICLEGCLDWIFYEEELSPGVESIAENLEFAPEGARFREVGRYTLCPREGKYGIQSPIGKWHSIEVNEPSTIFEGKDGAYREK